MYSEFIHASNVQTCSVCAEHPASAQPWIIYHLLFIFWSVETTQKDACCVQMFNARTEPYAYIEFNCASNMQICMHVIMTLRLSDHHSHLNSAERRVRDMRLNRANKPVVGLRYAFSANSEGYSCGLHFWIPKIASALWTVLTRANRASSKATKLFLRK